jgi:hypothetical protein
MLGQPCEVIWKVITTQPRSAISAVRKSWPILFSRHQAAAAMQKKRRSTPLVLFWVSGDKNGANPSVTWRRRRFSVIPVVCMSAIGWIWRCFPLRCLRRVCLLASNRARRVGQRKMLVQPCGAIWKVITTQPRSAISAVRKLWTILFSRHQAAVAMQKKRRSTPLVLLWVCGDKNGANPSVTWRRRRFSVILVAAYLRSGGAGGAFLYAVRDVSAFLHRIEHVV